LPCNETASSFALWRFHARFSRSIVVVAVVVVVTKIMEIEKKDKFVFKAKEKFHGNSFIAVLYRVWCH